MAHTLRMFMWGYQPHFRALFEDAAQRILETASSTLYPRALVVGVRHPEAKEGLEICIEPENGPLRESDFLGLAEEIQARIREHPDQHVFYGDDVRMAEKPEWIRQTATLEAVWDRLKEYDQKHGTISLPGVSTHIGNHDVFPVLQFEVAKWQAQLVLQKEMRDRYRLMRSFDEALVYELLERATKQLRGPDPGRFFEQFTGDPTELLRAAGRNLMYVPAWAGGELMGLGQLFDRCNLISSLRYEGAAGGGQMIIASVGHKAVQVFLSLRQPVALRDAGWARKVLEVASTELSLLSDSDEIYALGHLTAAYDPKNEDAFIVRFVGHYKWELLHASRILMRVEYGVPKLPIPRLDEIAFKKEAARILRANSNTNVDELWRVVAGAIEQKHGTMVVVTSLAADEAQRLATQATPIEPTILSEHAIKRVSAIDGAVLLDPSGTCHAIGVILDGRASANGTPSRGARYNSAIRYVDTARPTQVLAVVISEDGNIDIVPKLPPPIPRSAVEYHLELGRKAAMSKDWEKLRQAVRVLNRLRAYLDEAQATAANGLLQELDKEPREPTSITGLYNPFSPNPELDDSYFEQQ